MFSESALAYADRVAPAITLIAVGLVSLLFIIVWCWAGGQPRAVRLVGTLLILPLMLLIGATVVLTLPLYNS